MADGEATGLRAVVRGRVQGVNFRSFVYTRAHSLRLTGYVRNLADGRTVEVVAQGKRADLELLLDALREGPRGSRVDGVETVWGEDDQTYAGFGVG